MIPALIQAMVFQGVDRRFYCGVLPSGGYKRLGLFNLLGFGRKLALAGKHDVLKPLAQFLLVLGAMKSFVETASLKCYFSE